MIVNAIVVFVIAWRIIQRTKVEYLAEGYKQCVADCCRHVLSTKANEKDSSYNKAVDEFNEWMKTGFSDNELGIEWGTYLLNGDRQVLFVKVFGETAIEVKEVKDGDLTDE